MKRPASHLRQSYRIHSTKSRKYDTVRIKETRLSKTGENYYVTDMRCSNNAGGNDLSRKMLCAGYQLESVHDCVT